MKVYKLVTEEVEIQVMGTAITLKAAVEVMLEADMGDILVAVMKETLLATWKVDMGHDLAIQVGRQLAERLSRSMDPQGAELVLWDTISTKTTTTFSEVCRNIRVHLLLIEFGHALQYPLIKEV